MLKATYFLVSLILGFAHADQDCDKLGVLLYEDLGCKPVMKTGHDCPIRFECDVKSKNDACMFRGRSIPLRGAVDDNITYGNCQLGCSCSGPGVFTCAALDCPEWLGFPLTPGCYRKYELDKCCSVGQNCPSKTETFAECHVGGQKYLEDQQFYPQKTCLKCLCTKNFNGKFEAPHCKRMSCIAQIHDSDKIQRNCAPFYIKNDDDPICCPDEWVCPASSDEIITVNPKAEKNPDVTCQFGEKQLQLGEGLVSKVDHYGTMKDAKCECILPPWLTCLEIPSLENAQKAPERPQLDIKYIGSL